MKMVRSWLICMEVRNDLAATADIWCLIVVICAGCVQLGQHSYLRVPAPCTGTKRVRHKSTSTLVKDTLKGPDKACLVDGVIWACTGLMSLRSTLTVPAEGASPGGENGWYRFSSTSVPLPGNSPGGDDDDDDDDAQKRPSPWKVTYLYVSGSSAEDNERDAMKVPLLGVYYVCADDLPFVLKAYSGSANS